MHGVMASEAATGLVTTAAKMGRLNADALSEMAKSAKGTPFAPVFKANAVFASFAVESLERFVNQIGVDPKAVAPASKTKAPKVDALKAPVTEPVEIVEAVTTSDPVAEAAPADEPVSVVDLSSIDGVGPATLRKLNDAGITTLNDLAGYEVEALEKILADIGLRMTRFSPGDWIDQARELAA